MRAALAGALAVLASACATGGGDRPAFAIADLEALPTAALAARLLPGADPAAMDSHHVAAPQAGPRGVSTRFTFLARPRPVGEDVCARDIHVVSLLTRARPRPGQDARRMPARIDYTVRMVDLALAPGCRDIARRRFAALLRSDSTEIGAEILRALAAARTAAAAPGPLPFALHCEDRTDPIEGCPADVRATLAALPVEEAASLERQPLRACSQSPRETGDAAWFGDLSSDRPIWDVRLRHMGTADAEVLLIRRPPRMVC